MINQDCSVEGLSLLNGMSGCSGSVLCCFLRQYVCVSSFGMSFSSGRFDFNEMGWLN